MPFRQVAHDVLSARRRDEQPHYLFQCRGRSGVSPSHYDADGAAEIITDAHQCLRAPDEEGDEQNDEQFFHPYPQAAFTTAKMRCAVSTDSRRARSPSAASR